MSDAGLAELKEIFHSARELETDAQRALLDEACGTNSELRREVELLLESHRAAGEFIAAPPAQLAAELFGTRQHSDVGRVIGQYRLLECVGSGGMGAVYRAERADRQFEMQVAIKLIKRGMDTDAVLHRFEHERQILASLDHPNIARLLDGGTTDDGLPYFVMEYIKGERIDRYAEQHRLSVTARLELFRQVCGAVSYAHQQLVVHRDLKPSNVLVTPEGTPKLLDFGIAKLIQLGDGADALATLTIFPAMTPEYASPEQLDGGHATTLSDVYSLGAVLYELLTGQPPRRLQNRSAQEIAKALTSTHIERPSSVVARSDDARPLRGDLDNIVLMAMRTETARRYRSVEQFSEDIRRHLVGRPVVARRDTLSYRAGKFLQRNQLAVAASVLLLATLIGGIVATAAQARRARMEEQRARAEQARAERRFNEVRKLANSVLFDYHDAIKNLPGATKVRERLVKDALDYLDSLASEAHGDPALQRELAAAYERVGDVRGGAGGNLGDDVGALDSYAKAFAIREAIVAADSTNAEARHELANNHQKIGSALLGTKETSKGIEHLQKALALYLDLTQEQPANDTLKLDLVVAYDSLGSALDMRGDLAGALEQFRAALAICEPPAASSAHDQRFRRALWRTQRRIADMLFFQADLAGALEMNSKALAVGEGLIADDPINTEHRRALIDTYKDAGRYLSKSDKAAALENFRKAVALEEELLAADPANATIRKDLGFTHKRIADFAANAQDNAEALQHFSKAREIYEKAAADAPTDLASRFRVATCGAGLSAMQARLGDVAAAQQGCRNAIGVLGEISEDPTNSHHRHLRAEAHEYLGYAYRAVAESPGASASQRKERMEAAREMFQQTLAILDDLRQRGALQESDGWPESIAAELAKCDAALAKE